MRSLDGLTIGDVSDLIEGFVQERQWSKFHTPRNVLLALMGELGELAELYQWEGDEAPLPPPPPVSPESPSSSSSGVALAASASTSPSKALERQDKIKQEVADVAIYTVRLAKLCGVDLTEQDH